MFDVILGIHSLKELGAVIDINKQMYQKMARGLSQYKKFESVNVIIPRTKHPTESQKRKKKKYGNSFCLAQRKTDLHLHLLPTIQQYGLYQKLDASNMKNI